MILLTYDMVGWWQSSPACNNHHHWLALIKLIFLPKVELLPCLVGHGWQAGWQDKVFLGYLFFEGVIGVSFLWEGWGRDFQFWLVWACQLVLFCSGRTEERHGQNWRQSPPISVSAETGGPSVTILSCGPTPATLIASLAPPRCPLVTLVENKP